jgi:NADH-quinone oxidoreductase subunit I
MLGSGVIKGLVETARNFVGSYYDPARMVTVQYPEERRATPENGRNFPFLVYDGEEPEAGLRCVSCKICEKECPPQCIYILPERDARGKPQKHPRVFDIDISVCMSCQICVEVCPFDAIKMDQEFELSRSDRFAGLLLRKADLAKPNRYYHQIHPTEAAAVDAQIAAERQKQEAKAAGKATSAKPSGLSSTDKTSGPGPTSTARVSGSPAGEAGRPPTPEAAR